MVDTTVQVKVLKSVVAMDYTREMKMVATWELYLDFLKVA